MIGPARHSGVDALGDLPWGTHICQFYQSAGDLLETVPGYFRQGLADNEFCLWVCSDALGSDEARRALARVVADLDERIGRGQIEFIDGRDWCLFEGCFDAQRLLRHWVEKERMALDRGYAGMRVGADTAWVKEEHRQAFLDYEAVVNEKIGSHRTLALCLFPLAQWPGVQLLDIIRYHPLTLIKRAARWETIRSPDNRESRESLRENQQKQKAILDTIPDPAWLKDDAGRFLVVNAAWCRFTGRSAAEAQGKTAADVMPSDAAEAFHRQDSSVLQSGRPLHVEELLADNQGRRRWFETVKTPVCNDRGEVIGIVGRAHDITDRKATEESIRQAEARLRLALVASRMGVWEWDFRTRGLHCSPEVGRLFGLDDFQSTAEGVQEFLHHEDAPRVVQAAYQAVTQRTMYRDEFRIIPPGGEVRWVLVYGEAQYDESGTPLRMVGTIQDVTQRKQADQVARQAQSRLKLALATAQMGVWEWNVRTNRIVWSPETYRVFGARQFDGTYESEQAFLHPEDLPTLAAAIKEAMAGKRNFSLEFRVLRGDGEIRWVCGVGEAEYDPAGTPLRMVGTLMDITERKRAEDALRRSEARLREVFDNPLVAMGIGDATGRIIEVNDAFIRLFGYSREELLSGAIAWTQLSAPEYAEVYRRWLAELEANGRFGPYEKENIRKDGSRVPVLFGACRLPGLGNEHAAFFVDITDRKRAEQEKREMERRLLHAQKLESLGILAGGIAHDFNNILAGIMGYADLLKLRLPLSEPARDDLDVIQQAVARAAELTRQMLAYAGKGRFLVKPVSLSRIVEEMRKMLEVSISKKATLLYRLADDLPPVEADASQIHQVVLNLVINASEALGDGSGTIAVATEALTLDEAQCTAINGEMKLQPGRFVRLAVADTGCGMDEPTLARIFDPFFTTKFTGRGLGLAAVHGIVRGHQGAISVASRPGQGTTFHVYFPASQRSAAERPAPAPATAWQGRGTVLVVDDEELVRNLAHRMLQHAGFTVLTAANGAEALEVYRRSRDGITCVLLDLTMPKMDGAETLQQLRRIAPEVRVVLSSGYGEEGATQRFAGLGLAGFIQKPYQHDTLIAALRKALGE